MNHAKKNPVLQDFLQAVFAAVFCIFLVYTLNAQEDSAERYRQIIKYGTDTELTKLIQVLKQENDTSLDGDLLELVKNSKSAPVKQAVIGYFTQREGEASDTDGELAAITLDLLRRREDAEGPLITAALEYMAQKGAAEAAPVLYEIIDSGETRFTPQALRAYGKVLKTADAETKEKAAKFLRGFYREKTDDAETRRLVIEAAGEGELKDAAPFLKELIGNPDENSILRIEALNAAGKLGDALAGDELRGAVVAALNTTEPLVRTAAVGALSKFSGGDIDGALLDALKDSFFRTRLAAVKALAGRKTAGLLSADAASRVTGFLEFRARNDEAANVREESVKTLGIYETREAETALENIYADKRAAEKIRLMAAETLVKNYGGRWVQKLMPDMEEAKKSKQKTLYAGLLKALAAAKGGAADDIAAVLLSGDTTEQSYALDIIAANKFGRFRPQLEALSADTKNSLNKKAKSTLEKLKE